MAASGAGGAAVRAAALTRCTAVGESSLEWRNDKGERRRSAGMDLTCLAQAFTVAILVSTSFAWAQRPSELDVTALVERARQKALAYAQSLPDFVATEIIRRYTCRQGRGFETRPADSLTVQLRDFQHKEEHKLMLFNGEPTSVPFESLEGLVGSGEFGSTISAIFQPESRTNFRWLKWKTVRDRRAAVFAYVVDAAHSRYVLSSKIEGRTATATVSYSGTVECDAENGEVLHLEYAADHIPKELHLGYAATSVDYAFADIGGRDYLLPSRSETELHGSDQWVKNVIEFREYRKFSADSSVDFGPVK